GSTRDRYRGRASPPARQRARTQGCGRAARCRDRQAAPPAVPACPFTPARSAMNEAIHFADEVSPHLTAHRKQLACGLDVVIHPDDSVPQACVSMWYRVGSSDETPERTGFAHLFEHVFKTSEHMPAHHYDVWRRAGASEANASTSSDRTAYYEVVPAHELPLALWLEADRMGYFLPGMDVGRLVQQQAVVRAERRQRYEIVPY